MSKLKRRAASDDSSDEDSNQELNPPPASISFLQQMKRVLDRCKQKRARLEQDESEGEEDEIFDGLNSAEHERLLQAFASQAAVEAAVEAEMERVQPESGIVHSIESVSQLIDFMCHPHTTLTFGKQINFIVGHNGSGKSAFLTALTIALGGKASTTGRAQGLRELVRTGPGVSKAMIVLILHNKGLDAFKHKQYGDKIVITRTIHKDSNSSQYKLQAGSKKGPVIATNRQELSALCDHFNIAVDNPVNILTQDNARSFLQTSSPREKYQHFLTGTLLQQLTDDYDRFHTANLEINRSLQIQLASLDDLKRDATEAQEKWREVQASNQSADKIEKLKHQLAWAHVRETEETLQQAMSACAQDEHALDQIKRKKDRATSRQTEAVQEITRLDSEARRDEEVEAELQARIDEVDGQIRANTAQIREIQTEIRQQMEEINGHRTTIDQVEQDIAAARAKDANAGRVLEEIHAQIAQMTTDKDQAEIEVNQANIASSKALEDMQPFRIQFASAKEELDSASQQRHTAENRLRAAQSSSADTMRGYVRSNDSDIRGLLVAIQNQRWSGITPIGPIGTSIQLQDMKWSKVIETVLNTHLSGFIVSDTQDRYRLSQLLSRHRMRDHRIFVQRAGTLFDVSAKEPSPQYTTILRILKFDNPYVRNCLIDQAKIEQSVLVDSKRQGDDIMGNQRPANVRLCYTADAFSITRNNFGGLVSSGLNEYRGQPRLTKDMSRYIADCEADLRDCQQRQQQAQEKVANLNRVLTELSDTRKVAMRMADRHQKRVTKCTQEIDKLREKLAQQVPDDIAAYEETKREAEEAIASIAEQCAQATIRKNEFTAANQPLVQQRDELQGQLAIRSTERRDFNQQLEQAATARLHAENELAHYRKQEERYAKELDKKKDLVDALTSKLEGQEEQAKQVWEDRDSLPPIKKDAKAIAKLIEAQEKVLKAAEKSRGLTSDEIKLQLQKTTDRYTEARSTIDNLNELRIVLQDALTHRVTRWSRFLSYIAVRADMKFLKTMATRGYNGRLRFHHDKKLLSITVDTDNTQHGQRKDADTLSGGEKSFSTVAFLITLWDAVGCPIRGLDEFDVFQDSVNRGITVRNLIGCARATSGKQHIFITPNQVSGVVASDDVTILKLADPERNQGRLAMS